MKTLLITLLAIAAGFLAGLILSNVIGIVSVLVFQQPFGIKYLPVYLALLSGVIALAVNLNRRSKAR
jgi:hypothetical protein